MSVREALSEAVGLIVDIYDQEAIPDGYTILWDAVCDFVESHRGSDALASLREQSGVEKVARAIFAGRYGPGNEALWKIERWSYERDARAALRALGLEDA